MLFSHMDKQENQVLKPRNASVIAIDENGSLDLEHEGTLPKCKVDEWHEYFTVPQFTEFASDARFEYAPPSSCLLLLVRHGIALNNVNKAYTDGNLTLEGEASVVKASLRILQLLQRHDIHSVGIFSSACTRTRHSSDLLCAMLRRRQLSASRSMPCLRSAEHGAHHGTQQRQQLLLGAGSCGSETEVADEAAAAACWLPSRGTVPVGV